MPLRDGVTIVVTVFNKEYCLPLVVSALKRQSCPYPIEFIFVDDGSTDGSLDLICALTRDIDNVLIISQKNGGPTKALNRGLRFSNTVHTKGLDGDDILPPHATSLLLDALASHRECRWAYGGSATYDTFPPDTSSLFRNVASGNPAPYVVEDQLRKSLHNPHTNPSAWIAETAFLRSVDFCDDDIFIQDYSLELRMAANSPVVFVPSHIFYSHAVVTDRRMSANGRQTLHDCNLAVANLFSDYPKLIGPYGWDAARRVSGRAWHWARRHEGKTLMSSEYRNFVASRLRVGDPARIMRESCASFGGGIRKPGADDSFRVVVARGRFENDALVSRRDRPVLPLRPGSAAAAAAASTDAP